VTALAVLAGAVGMGMAVGPQLHGAEVGDSRLPAGHPDVPPALALAAQSVAFLDTAAAASADMPDGGTAILVSECLALTANHVFEALAGDNEAATLRLRFPALKQAPGAGAGAGAGAGEGELRAFAARLETRPKGLWRDPVADDWALLRLAESPGLPPLEIAPAACCGWQNLPAPAAVVGFPADKFDPATPSMWIDPDCAITRRLPIPVLATDCEATSGNSGGPLLVQAEDGWKLAAVLTRAPGPRRRGLSVGQTAYALIVEGRIARAIARAMKEPCAVAEQPAPAPAPEGPPATPAPLRKAP
jgi:hypothetical protein